MMIADRQARSHDNHPVGTRAYFNSAIKKLNFQMYVAYYASEALRYKAFGQCPESEFATPH
jgi:hypothetical protein